MAHTWRFRYHWEYIEARDGGIISLDWILPKDQNITFSGPIICIMPGTTGYNSDIYMISTAQAAVDNQWRAVLINHRGCSLAPINVTRINFKTPKLYCASTSDDFRKALEHIREKNPNDDLYGLGFSLGANMMSKYLGEEGERSLLKAAMGVCNPFNF
jgi:predicted alpha/beta-fold hydrolase